MASLKVIKSKILLFLRFKYLVCYFEMCVLDKPCQMPSGYVAPVECVLHWLACSGGVWQQGVIPGRRQQPEEGHVLQGDVLCSHLRDRYLFLVRKNTLPGFPGLGGRWGCWRGWLCVFLKMQTLPQTRAQGQDLCSTREETLQAGQATRRRWAAGHRFSGDVGPGSPSAAQPAACVQAPCHSWLCSPR